jgi:bifunctional non-homologous end joining protein LigD
MALEGIISKRADSPYVSRRDASWLKSKCNQRQEFVIIGYTAPQGGRKGFGSLLLGVHDAKKRLVYAGRVGTGFDDRLLVDLHQKLKKLEQKTPPTDVAPPPRERRAAHWVKPALVCEVRFTGWTRDNVLRHPAFIALRADKEPAEVVHEMPVDPADVAGIEPSTSSKPRSAQRDGRAKKSKTPAKSGGAAADRKRGKNAAKNSKSTDSRPTKASSSPTIAGVSLSHPDKILYPDAGVTKHDLAAYYAAVAEWMLPHVVDRPLALLRCPGGTGGKCFFQRNWSNTLPPAVGKVDVSDSKKKEEHVMVTDLPGVISLVQIGVLEIHTWNCQRGRIEHPDQLIFDLDPGPDVAWTQIVQAARTVRKELDALKLPTFLKTSGGKGLHITIPIEPTIDWDAGKRFCETIVKSLAERSDQFVANMRKDLRGGKIYLDYHRNGRTATAVAPYSSRAREGAPVSMPISWDELGKLSSANHFTVETAGRYLEKRKADPWKAFDRSRVDLHKLLRGKSAA